MQIKQALLALRSANISQKDWHSDQILCLKTLKGIWEIVFIDFAFAYLDVGSDNGSLIVRDWPRLYDILQTELRVSEQIMKEYWTTIVTGFPVGCRAYSPHFIS